MSEVKAWDGTVIRITGGNPRWTGLTGRVEHVNKNGSAKVRLDTLPGLTGRLVTIQQHDLEVIPATAFERAIAATPPGHRYADRELLNIIRLGLCRIYTGPDSEASEGMREAARQALARLDALLATFRVIRPGTSAYIHPEGMPHGMTSPGVLVENNTDTAVTVHIRPVKEGG